MIAGMAARLLTALALTGLVSQSVEFTQQYLQRLGGAADELADVVRRFDAGAAAADMGRDQALARLSSNPDDFVAGQGRDMATTIARADAVERRYRALSGAAPVLRPVVLAGDPDWSIAERTLDDFRPALPVSADGLLLTLAGFLFGWALGATGHGAVRLDRKRRERRRQARPPWHKPLLIAALPGEVEAGDDDPDETARAPSGARRA